MYETKIAQLKLTWWPSPQDYNEAIQIPRCNLQDAELCRSLVYTDTIGLPRPVTGSFASVYRMHCEEKDYALRLFLHNINDQEERYALVSDFVQHDDLPYTVSFHFLKSGIKFRGEWLPALKMEWVEGVQLDDYIVENLGNANKLGELAENFLTMMSELQLAGIAHGDLQHGNIIICGDELRLVDYDGMFVPAMQGLEANELGHRNYQHPERGARHFGPSLDNFSAWVIYTSVRALQIDSRLMHQLGAGDDCLLFRQIDFLNPLHSSAFLALEQHESAEINALARFIRGQLKNDPSLVPPLQIPVPPVAVELEPLSSAAAPLRSGPRLVRGTLPAWLRDDNATPALSLAPADHKSDGSGEHSAPPTVQPSWPVPAKSAQAAQWVKPTAAAAASSVPVIAVPTLHLSGTIPPDLVKQGPRQVTFNHSSGRQSPESWQKLMLLLPFVWMFLVMGYLALGPDNDLRTKGIDYPATVFAYSYIIPNTNFASVRGPLYQVILSYKVNGVPYTIFTGAGADDIGKYKVGSQFAVPVHAMPTNPTYREDLGAQAGARQRHDVMVCMLCTLVNFLLEAAIWIPAINQRDLAQYGVAVLARVDRLKREAKTNGLASYTEYTAEVSFLPPGNTFPVTREVRVSKEQHFSLTAGNTEVMLCKQNNPDEPKFYRFCRYRAVP